MRVLSSAQSSGRSENSLPMSVPEEKTGISSFFASSVLRISSRTQSPSFLMR